MSGLDEHEVRYSIDRRTAWDGSQNLCCSASTSFLKTATRLYLWPQSKKRGGLPYNWLITYSVLTIIYYWLSIILAKQSASVSRDPTLPLLTAL